MGQCALFFDRVSIPIKIVMIVGAHSPSKIPKCALDAPSKPAAVPLGVIHTTMLAMTDKNPSAYERFALKPSALSFFNIIPQFCFLWDSTFILWQNTGRGRAYSQVCQFIFDVQIERTCVPS